MAKLFSDEALAVATIWAEGRSEPLDGKVAIAEVILNRMRFKYFSDGTVAGTVLRPWQFSCFNTDTKWRAAIFQLDWDSEAVQECRKAWQLALGANHRTVGDAVLYHTVKAPSSVVPWPPRWATASSVSPVKTIDRHIFYEDRG